jgi:hypothetical protein
MGDKIKRVPQKKKSKKSWTKYNFIYFWDNYAYHWTLNDFEEVKSQCIGNLIFGFKKQL